MFSWALLGQIIVCGVVNKSLPLKWISNKEGEELSGITIKAWLQGHGKSGPLSDRLRQRTPQKYFTFAFAE